MSECVVVVVIVAFVAIVAIVPTVIAVASATLATEIINFCSFCSHKSDTCYSVDEAVTAALVDAAFVSIIARLLGLHAVAAFNRML